MYRIVEFKFEIFEHRGQNGKKIEKNDGGTCNCRDP